MKKNAGLWKKLIWKNRKIYVELSDEVTLELQKCLRLLQLLSIYIKKLQCPVSGFPCQGLPCSWSAAFVRSVANSEQQGNFSTYLL